MNMKCGGIVSISSVDYHSHLSKLAQVKNNTVVATGQTRLGTKAYLINNNNNNNSILKPTNVTTQGELNPRKSRFEIQRTVGNDFS